MNDREQFEAVQRRYAVAVEREDAYRFDVLFARYRKSRPERSWLTRSEIAKLETFSRAKCKQEDAMSALLARIGGRDWHSGAGAGLHWIMTELTYTDAITTGPLSVVPPPAYGRSTRDAERFAMPVSA